MHSAGTLPLHMYQKDIPVGEAIQFEDRDSEAVASESQESEYDSDSEQEQLEHEPTQGDDLLSKNNSYSVWKSNRSFHPSFAVLAQVDLNYYTFDAWMVKSTLEPSGSSGRSLSRFP